MDANKQMLLAELTQNTIYLMGASFIVGSLFTILLLMLLDFMRRNKKDDAAS